MFALVESPRDRYRLLKALLIKGSPPGYQRSHRSLAPGTASVLRSTSYHHGPQTGAHQDTKDHTGVWHLEQPRCSEVHHITMAPKRELHPSLALRTTHIQEITVILFP